MARMIKNTKIGRLKAHSLFIKVYLILKGKLNKNLTLLKSFLKINPKVLS